MTQHIASNRLGIGASRQLKRGVVSTLWPRFRPSDGTPESAFATPSPGSIPGIRPVILSGTTLDARWGLIHGASLRYITVRQQFFLRFNEIFCWMILRRSKNIIHMRHLIYKYIKNTSLLLFY